MKKLALILGLALMTMSFNRDPFSQTTFPCQEDEALIFIVSPTNDRTGCVNLDRLD